MWTEITRPKNERKGLRYASDVSDDEWLLIEPHLPGEKLLGRPREVDVRAVFNAILYIARTGCQWRLLPRDFPPFTGPCRIRSANTARIELPCAAGADTRAPQHRG
jgi:transposase